MTEPIQATSPSALAAIRCVLYARVSTDRQAEKDLSIPAQLRVMRDHAAQQGWAVAEEFLEPGFTATNAARPMLQAILQRARTRTLGASIVLAYKLNRMSRNTDDYGPIRKELLGCGVKLRYVADHVDDTPSGRLIENIMVSVSDFQSRENASDVKRAMRERVLNGGWPHRPPRGYVMVKRSGEKRSRCEVHPRLGPFVARAFELYGTGRMSMKTVAKQLATEGFVSGAGTPISHSNMHQLLTKGFYAGRIRWQDLDVQGTHPPLVTSELFERVQAIVKQRYILPLRHRTDAGFPLKGIARCVRCRGHMTAERHGRWGYYRCSRKANDSSRCDARFCPARRAHEDVSKTLKTLQITRDTAVAIQKEAFALIDSNQRAGGTRQQALVKRQAELRIGLTKLSEAFLAGSLAPTAYQKDSQLLKAEHERLATSVLSMARDPAASKARVKRTLDVSTTMFDLHQTLDDARRLELLHTLFAQVILGADGVVGHVLKAPFDEIHGAGSPAARASALVDATGQTVAAA